MTNLVNQPIEWVDTDDQLEECCLSWQGKKLLAIDTEFMRSQTYYPKAGLIQVNDGYVNVLIDPLKISNFKPFADILTDADTVKALHSCSEDLEVISHLMGVYPESLFDTQLAAAFCGYGFSVGYGNLVKLVLNEELPKEETRSDWLQRPLSQSQVQYAAMDVEHLYLLAHCLVQELTKLERLSWVIEESNAIPQLVQANSEPENSYQRVKSAWKLNQRQLFTLMHLCAWRENVAKRRNIPRNRVVKEHTLFDIAQSLPKHISQLRKLNGLNERTIKIDGQTLVDIANKARELDEALLPPCLPRPLSGDNKVLLHSMKEEVENRALELNVAPELLVRKKDYEFILNSSSPEEKKYRLPEGFSDWRRQVIADQLIHKLNTMTSESE
ncbi:ribonuclease D [Teredinibacter sp. KSP-S5-2]|uniref:ribonuclease D n=1 Tax=Teredinibacter sp. KSP-S5-2 TaxID=3034506 RepID=UPI002934E1AC|nr:ribonuclease D [Teredinibacter sp. KSP-S5-2]WNO11668.1 ribonuclease D [Teredinibacter sp. KSP-S5-2]